jgi:hypothetical protein
MTEMTNLPEAPAPRKPTPWKVIIPVAIVIIVCCLCIAVVGVLMYLGTQGSGPFASLANSPILNSSSTSLVGDWDLYYDWSCSETYNGPATFSFAGDGTYSATEFDSVGYGTWTVQGSSVDFIYNDYPNAHYVGTLSGARAEGTMSTSDGSNGCWYATKH